MIPTTIHSFLGLFLSAVTVGVGYTLGAWAVGRLLK